MNENAHVHDYDYAPDRGGHEYDRGNGYEFPPNGYEMYDNVCT